MSLQTRWMDNDIYGHVNNVTYYSYFDTVVNSFLINEGGFDPHGDTVIGVAVETMCAFKKSIAFPEPIEAGLRVGKLGNTSVRYEEDVRLSVVQDSFDERVWRRGLPQELIGLPGAPVAGQDVEITQSKSDLIGKVGHPDAILL